MMMGVFAYCVAETLVGPGADTPIPAATGGGPGVPGGSYGAPSSQPTVGKTLSCFISFLTDPKYLVIMQGHPPADAKSCICKA